MGRMKEVFMLKREQESIENEHLDDAYWYQRYLDEKQYAELEQKEVVQESVQQNVQKPQNTNEK
jgi:hypothetical protein